MVWSFCDVFFFNFAAFLGPFLGRVVNNAKHKKVAPGVDLNLCNLSKNPSFDNWVPQIRFPKMYIFWAQIESEGSGMVYS